MIIKKKFANWQIKKVIFLLLFFCFLITPLIITIPIENNKSIIKVATVIAEEKKTVVADTTNSEFLSDIKAQLDNTASNIGLKPTGNRGTDLKIIISNVIKVVLTFLGIIAIIMIIIGGLMWMTSGGNEDRVKKARGILVNAIIGLFIVLLAYVITYWVVNVLGTEVLI
jgi:tetrahydromethanopterin S-methyltransferase subunit G